MVTELSDEDASEALDYLSWLTTETETLNDHELAAMLQGEDEIARGEFVTMDELTRTLGG
jgi:hypothetical protein